MMTQCGYFSRITSAMSGCTSMTHRGVGVGMVLVGRGVTVGVVVGVGVVDGIVVGMSVGCSFEGPRLTPTAAVGVGVLLLLPVAALNIFLGVKRPMEDNHQIPMAAAAARYMNAAGLKPSLP